MIGPFTEEQIAYMQTSVEARKDFDVFVKLKMNDGSGRWGGIHIKNNRIAEEDFDEYFQELWSEPYLISVNLCSEGNSWGHGFGSRIDEFLPVHEFIEEYIDGWMRHYEWEPQDEQLRWF